MRSFPRSFARTLATPAALAAVCGLIAIPAPSSAQGSAGALDRGRYLVESILACGNCHTPKAPNGEPIAARNLSGGGLTFTIPPYAGPSSNITPDRDTGIGGWSDADIKRAIVEGKRPGHGRQDRRDLLVAQPRIVLEGAVRRVGAPGRHRPGSDARANRLRPRPRLVVLHQRHRREHRRPMALHALGIQDRRHVF